MTQRVVRKGKKFVILGWPKSLSRFFHKLSRKNPSELFGQLFVMCSQPGLKQRNDIIQVGSKRPLMALAGARVRAGGERAGFPSSEPLQKRPAASNLSDFFYLLMYGFSFLSPFFKK